MPVTPLSNHHHRRSIRLPAYDYSRAGAYFVTICAYQCAALFGEVVADNIRLNDYGQIAAAVWADLPRHYPHVALDAGVIMPNHIHGIIVLKGDDVVGAGLRPAPTVGPAPTVEPAPTTRQPLSEIVRAFKSFSARRINELRGTVGVPVWQRNYYERVIRHERELNAIRDYIARNPANWQRDSNHV